MGLLEELVCGLITGGHKWEWERNIYGDEINLLGGRSEWKCKNCKAIWIKLELLNPELPQQIEKEGV